MRTITIHPCLGLRLEANHLPFLFTHLHQLYRSYLITRIDFFHSEDISFRLGKWLFNYNKRLFYKPQGQQTKLTRIQAKLLLLTCKHKERIVRYEEILQYIWNEIDFDLLKNLDTTIARLNALLKRNLPIELKQYESGIMIYSGEEYE